MADILLHERITEVTVCALPPEHEEYGAFALTVVHWAADLWSVRHPHNRYALNRATGEFEHDSCPEDVDRHAWYADRRFDYDTAIVLARKAAPTMRRNGISVDDVRAWHTTEKEAT